MKVDISDITRVNGASLELGFEEPVPEEELVEGISLNMPVGFKGTLTNINGMIVLEGRLNTGYLASCYRCLKPVGGKIDIRISENFVNGEQSADEIDAYAFEGRFLNTDKAFNDNIILNLPMKQICEADCKGLCQKCGINLNEASCNCSENSINPQMEILNKFFDN